MIGNTVKISTVFIAATLLCTPPLPLATAQTKSPPKPEVEFVQTAKSVAFKDGVLTLQDVAPATVFFSDRPERLVGHVRNDLFLKRWTEGSNSFKSDPPNAVLSVFNDKGRPTSAIVLLSNPRIDGKNMLYDAKTLKGTLPATGGEGTLFIDGSGAPCDPAFNQGDSGYPCWAQQAFAAAGGGL
jgi:hypothetical protein